MPQVSDIELIILLIGIGCSIVILLNRRQFLRLPGAPILITAYFVLVLGWILTILEGFFWGNLLNLSEHICYTASDAFVAFWCWKTFGRREG